MMILDLSRWQGEFDAEKAKAAGAVGVIIRCTVGNYYTDPNFATNFQRTKDAGLLAGAYHVHNPTSSAISQIDRFLNVVGTRVVDFPHTMDVEIAAGQTPYTITTNLKACMTYMPRVRGKLPSIYTAKWYWDLNILNDGHDWSIYPLHVANYSTAAAPVMPKSWTKWTLWQYSADNNGLGGLYGVESADVDVNRFNGDMAALRAFCGLEAVQPFPSVPAVDWPRPMRSRGDWRPLRTGPSTMANIYGSLSPLLTVLAYAEVAVGADRWVRLTPAGVPEIWTARLYQGQELMRFV